jgi:DNA-binding beta-propeller fold protein YncE
MLKTQKRNVLIGSALFGAFTLLGVGQSVATRTAQAQAAAGSVMAPYFEVDPTWPKPLPNGYQLGQTIGVSVDAQDHVWIIHRANPDAIEAAGDNKTGLCCHNSDPIMEFDQAGNLLRHWGGKDDPQGRYTWPNSNHGIWVDNKQNVWIGGNGGDDGMVLKFDENGKFLLKVGGSFPAADSNAMDRFWKVAKVHMYPKTNEVFVADGYGNKRVAVIDADTGKMKRYWGAYGEKPVDGQLPAYVPGAPLVRQFRGPVHCAEPSNDGFVYVCDRTNDRLQIFTLDGKYVSEIQVTPEAKSDGSTWDVDFSKDAAQTYLYLADGRNQKIHIFDRKSMVELTNFGSGGHYPGEWYSLHSIAVDSRGNLYTTETYQGRRVQKFTYRGLRPVTRKEQGVVWPSNSGR